LPDRREDDVIVARPEHFPALKKVDIELPKTAAPPLKVSVPIALPGETEEEAFARIEKKKREEAEKKAAEEAEAKRLEEERLAAAKASQEAAEKAKAVEGSMLDTFASGDKLGEDLDSWCKEQGDLLPTVDKLVFALLTKREKTQPKVDCPWAAPSQFGTALSSLCNDNLVNQIGVLWGIQRYCDSIGFPKLGNEGVIQAMFRSMYKYDLAEEDAFSEWKEDESSEHQAGKLKALVQTVEWFTWLEEEEEEEEEEDYEG